MGVFGSSSDGLDKLIELSTGGDSGTPELIHVFKDTRSGGAALAASIAGRLYSMLTYEGSPSHGVVPGAVAIPVNTLDGSIKQTDPGGGREKFLVGISNFAQFTCTLYLYDCLSQIGGLSGTTTTAQTTNNAIDRYTGSESVGNEIWVHIYTLIGTTATTATVEYTDQDGNASQVSPAFTIGGTGFREAQRIIPVPLAAGDNGVRATANIDLLATTGTAGSIGVSIVRRIATVDVPLAAIGRTRDITCGLGVFRKVKTDACLLLAYCINSTSPAQHHSSFMFVEA